MSGDSLRRLSLLQLRIYSSVVQTEARDGVVADLKAGVTLTDKRSLGVDT